MTISGNYENDIDRFTPTRSEVGNSTSSWAFFNWNNNPFAYDTKYRLNFRFRHKLGKQAGLDENAEGGDKEANNSLIRNLSYTILAGFERENSSQEDFRHKDNFFNRGYMGNSRLLLRLSSVSWIMVTNFLKRQLGYQRVTGDFVAQHHHQPCVSPVRQPSNGIMRSDRSSVWSNLLPM